MTQPGYIDITGVDLRELVRAAYDLSSPQGLGFLHAREGGLDDETVDEILKQRRVSMDYVHGRSVKMHVRRDGDDKLFINSDWYDHGTGQLKSLLQRLGLDPDLVERAQQSRQAWYDGCREKAMSALKEAQDGTVSYDMESDGDEDLRLGLFLLMDDRAVRETFDYPVYTYHLVAENGDQP